MLDRPEKTLYIAKAYIEIMSHDLELEFDSIQSRYREPFDWRRNPGRGGSLSRTSLRYYAAKASERLRPDLNYIDALPMEDQLELRWWALTTLFKDAERSRKETHHLEEIRQMLQPPKNG